ncbi:hypothetical protein TI05_08695 [Achromatium sp. WMS3]|nr:hypothetical protein TI05_08695 [Achromatium sp. WMS3]
MIRCSKCQHFYDPNQHTNCPYCPIPLPSWQDVGETIGTQNSSSSESSKKVPQRIDSLKRPQDLKTRCTIKFLVGWLICIEGSAKGQDFRIYSERNFIGSGNNMDICIKDDAAISESHHAEINFDARSNKFYIATKNSNDTYLNAKLVKAFTPLDSWDTIKIGQTKLLFVALCGSNFNWIDGSNSD